MFCRVSSYRLHVNEQNAPEKRCVWKTHFEVDRFKNKTRTSLCKREKGEYTTRQIKLQMNGGSKSIRIIKIIVTALNSWTELMNLEEIIRSVRPEDCLFFSREGDYGQNRTTPIIAAVLAVLLQECTRPRPGRVILTDALGSVACYASLVG